MKINKISIHRLQIPLRLRFEQSNNSAAHSDSTIVELHTENGCMGRGESCPRLYVTGEDFTSVFRDIQGISAWLKEREFQTIDDIRELATRELPQRIGMSAVCALELALLDAWCKENNSTIASALGVVLPERVQYSGVVPLRSLEGTTQLMTLMGRFGFKEIKLKVDNNLATNLERIEAIRAAFPAPVPLRLDVNCAWSWDDALLQIPALRARGITIFEQVFHPKQDEVMARLQRYFGEDICLMADESVTTMATAQRLIEQQACRRFNLKISKNGGLFNTLAIYRLSQEQGISCQLGAHFGETCILTTAGLVLAGMTGGLTAIEGGLGTHLLEYDLCSPPLQIDASAAIESPALQLDISGWRGHAQESPIRPNRSIPRPQSPSPSPSDPFPASASGQKPYR